MFPRTQHICCIFQTMISTVPFVFLFSLSTSGKYVVMLKEEPHHYKTCLCNMSRRLTKSTKWLVRPAKTQISLDIRPVWSEPSLCALWVVKDPNFLQANSEDSDQTGRMDAQADPRSESLLGVKVIFLVLSCSGSYENNKDVDQTANSRSLFSVFVVRC